MELISAFKSELFRPLVMLIIPDAVAIGPLWSFAITEIPGLYHYLDSHSAAAWAISLLVVTFAGLVMEDFGSRIEVAAWDRLGRPEDTDDSDAWRQYLKLNTQDQIVGQRYLRTVLVRMKFELAMAPACLICVIGLWLLDRKIDQWFIPIWALAIGALAGCGYSLFESYTSSRVLADTRRLVLTAASSSGGGQSH